MNFRDRLHLERIATAIARDRGKLEVVHGIAAKGKTTTDIVTGGMISIEKMIGMILARRGGAVTEIEIVIVIEIETIDDERDRHNKSSIFALYVNDS